MGLLKGIVNFGFGAIAGAVAGSALGLLFAPGSGDDVRQRVRSRLDDAKTAGDEAETAKQRELIEKYRLSVKDPGALASELPPR